MCQFPSFHRFLISYSIDNQLPPSENENAELSENLSENLFEHGKIAVLISLHLSLISCSSLFIFC